MPHVTMSPLPAWRQSLFCTGFLLIAWATTVAAAPRIEWETNAWSTAPRTGSIRGGSSQTLTSSLLVRQPLPGPNWFWSYGIQAENYAFSAMPGVPRTLQDYAAQFAVEYQVGDETAAQLALRPGYYFERHPSAAAWDVPVDLVSGVPINGQFSGVVGFSNARFYHHALPIFGVVWTINPRARLQLVYPEPALEIKVSRTLALRVGGELTGSGFRTDTRSVVEYSSYRVGAELSWQQSPHLKLACGAGAEVMRAWDAFRQNGRLAGPGGGYLKLCAVVSR